MKYLLILFYSSFLIGCSNSTTDKNIDEQGPDFTSDTIAYTNEISRHLTTCLPERWIAWEESAADKKTYLAHIGKGIFDLHFKADYGLVDTLLGENYNGKNGNKYYPEIILHFYSNSKEVRESVKLTEENPTLISDVNFAKYFAKYFGETKEFLIYECSTEKQMFLPEDKQQIKLRKCMLEKLTTYSSK
ncbi:hypothetical protein BH11BAC7_BH11BAC7_36750 [soil metagenome]